MRQPNDIKHAKRDSLARTRTQPWMRAHHRPTSRNKLLSRSSRPWHGGQTQRFLLRLETYSPIAPPPFVVTRAKFFLFSPTWNNKSRVPVARTRA